MRRVILGLVIIPLSLQAQTLEECQHAAERNYPLIRQYDLDSEDHRPDGEEYREELAATGVGIGASHLSE